MFSRGSCCALARSIGQISPAQCQSCLSVRLPQDQCLTVQVIQIWLIWKCFQPVYQWRISGMTPGYRRRLCVIAWRFCSDTIVHATQAIEMAHRTTLLPAGGNSAYLYCTYTRLWCKLMLVHPSIDFGLRITTTTVCLDIIPFCRFRLFDEAAVSFLTAPLSPCRIF